MTRTTSSLRVWQQISTHILTRRMTEDDTIFTGIVNDFNSHPHKEDDMERAIKILKQEISTHILTRRMTAR